jgi:hypothetical protein
LLLPGILTIFSSLPSVGAIGVTNQPWSLNSLGQVAGYSCLSDDHGGYHNEGFFHDGTPFDRTSPAVTPYC